MHAVTRSPDAKPQPPPIAWHPGEGTAEILAKLLTQWQVEYFGCTRRDELEHDIRRFRADDPDLAPLVAYIGTAGPDPEPGEVSVDISRAGMSASLHVLASAITRLYEFTIGLITIASETPDRLRDFASTARSAPPTAEVVWWLYDSMWSSDSSVRAMAARDWIACYGTAAQLTSFEARFWAPYSAVEPPLLNRILYGEPWPTLRDDLEALVATVPYLTMLAGAVAQPEPGGTIVVAAPSRAERDALTERRQIPLDVLRKRHPLLFEPGPFAVLRVLLADPQPWSARALAPQAELPDGRHPARTSVQRWLEELLATGLATKGDEGGWTAGDACYTRPADT